MITGKKRSYGLLRYLLLVILLVPIIGFAQSQDNWIKIAEKTVSFKAEKDVITPQGNEKTVDKIRVKCISGTLHLKKVRVEMRDGQKKEYDAKGTGILTKGMTSLAFDLPGKDNELRKIEIEYDSKGNMVLTNKAKVEIQGRRIKNK
jgi:hypothetical protein